MAKRNDTRSRLDFERNRSRKFVKDQVLSRLGSQTQQLAKIDTPIAPTGSAMDDDFTTSLNRMIAESGGKLSITSGKRSPERQQQLWEQALQKYGDPEIADNWVARPGTSNHERGLAADLRFADDAARQWAHANAGNYGLHFPMSWENWHIEPIKKGGGSVQGSAPSAPSSPSPVGSSFGGGQPQFKIESGWDQPQQEDSDSSDYGLRDYIESKYKPKQAMTPTGGGIANVASVGQDGRKTTGDPFLDEIIYGAGGHPGESNFRTDADNPQSSAFGIGQLIESNRQRYGQQLGIDPNTQNEAEQLALMRAYIEDRYGSSQAAAEFRRQRGWY